MGQYQPTRVPKRLIQPNSSSVNLDESSYRPSVKGMDPVESSSASLHLPPEVGINQVGESDNVSNSRSWQYLTELILDVIKALEGGTQEIPIPQTTSDPNHEPRGVPVSMTSRSDPVFGESGGDPSGNPSDNPTKYPSPVSIINPDRVKS